MESNWAAEHLQTIRTLMERSALYRRALAPIMTFCGVLGIVAGLAGLQFRIESNRGFVLFWNGIAAAALLGSFLLVRRQALKEAEPFWSPPTRRVAQALLLPFVIGLMSGVSCGFGLRDSSEVTNALVIVWVWLYGCALHSAGFFISRGIRILGWIFGLTGCGLLGNMIFNGVSNYVSPNLLMAGLFGGLHLAYGIYLYFTEKGRNET